MILDKDDKDSILNLMSDYKESHDALSEVETTIKGIQEQLKALYESKDNALRSLEKVRINEIKVTESLNEKYGEGKLDVQSFEWVKKTTA